MIKHKDAKLLINGHIAYRFQREEKALASKYNIPYTTVTNEESNTDIGAVLAYDYAIDKENIFIEDNPQEEKKEKPVDTDTFISKIKNWFT